MHPRSYCMGKVAYTCSTLVFLKMPAEISIQIEKQNHGNWLNIFIPFKTDEDMIGVLLNENGDILKKVELRQGSNSIDISNIDNATINVKVETTYETIFKNLNLGL